MRRKTIPKQGKISGDLAMSTYKVKDTYFMLKGIPFVMIICIIMIFFGCTLEENEKSKGLEIRVNKAYVSESMNYETLRAYYSKSKGCSLNDAEGRLALMNITKEEDTVYRVISQKIEGSKNGVPIVEFYLETSESDKNWTIKKIKQVIVGFDRTDEDAVILGGITCWLRKEENMIEYSLDCDLYKAADVEGEVICREEADDKILHQSYVPEEPVNNEKGDNIRVHEFIEALTL